MVSHTDYHSTVEFDTIYYVPGNKVLSAVQKSIEFHRECIIFGHMGGYNTRAKAWEVYGILLSLTGTPGRNNMPSTLPTPGVHGTLDNF
ncbi:hypothetical protein PGT21_006084 [Puccinia graminis f. sp. tritici]|uniref:Uncharacterized protein n=1 Tax=Puccinia graminis f. sp. tritici TaxID=56615 RepID=A0A5B0MQS5_PUCGR|nr:hypothetical protein PGT21_006084 [Puccinia graminis f. sp. tritici]